MPVAYSHLLHRRGCGICVLHEEQMMGKAIAWKMLQWAIKQVFGKEKGTSLIAGLENEGTLFDFLQLIEKELGI